MCEQVVQFCSNSTRPLLFLGSLLTLALAVAVGYLACTSQALYAEVDPSVASEKAPTYYLQLLASGYLCLVALFACFGAYYDQKHSIRALAVIASANFVLAAAAIALLPAGADVGALFAGRLQRAQTLYDFGDKPAELARVARWIALDGQPTAAPAAPAASATPAPAPAELSSANATLLWDRLQRRGCCGIANATREWKDAKLPKSCCQNATATETGQFFCREPDERHQEPCLKLLAAPSLHLLVALALAALINLYLASVTGVSTYRTFHYNEASQNAYS